MKVYRKLVIDIASDRILDSVAYDNIDGPIALAKGGSTKSTTVVNVPPPTAEETRSKALANIIQQAQLEELGYNVVDDGSGNLRLEKRPATPEQLEQQEFDKALQKQIRQRLLGGPIDEETKKAVGDVYQSQRTLGDEDINRFLREQAGARGLDLATDSPILREAGLAKSRLETGLRGAEAASLLDVGNREQLFAQALNEFQTGLRQQSFLNRQMLSEQAMGQGLGLAQQRYSASGQTQTSKGGGGNGSLIGAGIGAAGSIVAAGITAF